MRKKADTPDTFADLQFPRQGVDLLRAFDMQQLGSTPVGVNVRTFEALTQRGRGGSRPGIAKYLTDQLPNGSHLIQHLGVIVDPTTDALLDDIDPDDPDDPLYMDDPSTNNLRTRNPGRKVRIGGRGYGMSKNKRKKTKPIKFVQGQTYTFDSDVTQGNLLIVLFYQGSSGSDVPGDTLGNTYVQAGGAATADGGSLTLWYALSVASGPCSMTGLAGEYNLIAEFSGVSAVDPLDDVQVNSGTLTGTPFGTGAGLATIPGLNVTGSGELVLYLAFFEQDSVSTPTGFTKIYSGSAWNFYKINPDSGSQAPSLTYVARFDSGGNNPWRMIAASFNHA